MEVSVFDLLKEWLSSEGWIWEDFSLARRRLDVGVVRFSSGRLEGVECALVHCYGQHWVACEKSLPGVPWSDPEVFDKLRRFLFAHSRCTWRVHGQGVTAGPARRAW